VCFALLLVFNFVALIMANVEAVKARQVKVEYGESKYIGMAMGLTLQIFLVGTPLLFLVSDSPSANYFVKSSIVFCVSMSFLMFLFVPKLWVWYRKPAERISAQPTRNGLSCTKRSFGGNAVSDILFSSLFNFVAPLSHE
jgi:7 transmembrane sweet-taste receptor of 3 GCPR